MTFCVGNMGSKSIFFDIQFYHGLFLEDSFESNVRGHELEDLADRWGNLLKMVEANYEVYQRHLFGRRSSSQRLTFILTLMVALMIVGTAIMKCIYYRRVVTFLKEKKAVWCMISISQLLFKIIILFLPHGLDLVHLRELLFHLFYVGVELFELVGT